jgi:hypothetical protein
MANPTTWATSPLGASAQSRWLLFGCRHTSQDAVLSPHLSADVRDADSAGSVAGTPSVYESVLGRQVGEPSRVPLLRNCASRWFKCRPMDDTVGHGRHSKRELWTPPTVLHRRDASGALVAPPVDDPVPSLHSRSPGLKRRWASRARSSAVEAAYRASMSRLRQPASRIRSPSVPPAASQE